MNEDRVLVVGDATFEMQGWSGANTSGIEPLGDKVLVLVDPAKERSKGGIILTETKQEIQSLSSTSGILVAVGPAAFVWDSDRAHRWEGEKPTPGLRVIFQKYGGQEYTGEDGRLYRLMQDRVLGGTRGLAEIVSEPVAGSAENIVQGGEAFASEAQVWEAEPSGGQLYTA